VPWYDDPIQYYADVGEDDALSQGDIVFAATLVVEPGSGETNIAGPTGPGERRRITLWPAAGDALPAAPAMAADVSWGLAMVVPHRCALEKEWNEALESFLAEGSDRAEAERRATATPGLDRFVTIAPLVPLDQADPSKQASISRGDRLGAFPVCADATMPRAYADLYRVTTVDERLVRVTHRVKALSDKARAKLQLGLSLFFAARSKSKLGEIEAAVGKSIEDVVCVAKANKVLATFVFTDGSKLVLEGNAGEVPKGRVPERPARR